MYDIAIDEKWNRHWSERKLNLFDENDTKRPIYVIDTPPPFTSGTLHMGHVFGYSLIDAIARYKRMKGFNVLYPQGWDTQGFPTEKAVEKKYGTKLTREEFYQRAVEIADENLKAMRQQMYVLGFSPDERYGYTTMSKEYRAKVQLSLLLMYEKGFVYRDKAPVEWCPSCNSAIAHAETEEKTIDTTLMYVKFAIVGSKSRHITVATTRPELMHACVAVAVNPKDERFSKLIGKSVRVPIFDNKVEIIADEGVEKEFGTGAEMVCTFGDKADREMYYRHKLNLIDSLDEHGRLKNAKEFTGMKILEARPLVTDALDKCGALEKREAITHTIKIHDRCSTEIELIISTQWFIRIREHTKKIVELGKEMKWIPEFTEQYLDDWARFIDWDWIISRNRIFGTPIPFWYCEKCNFILAPKRERLPIDPTRDKPEIDKCPKCNGRIIGESATCDVWVDSSITPLVIAGWPENRALLERAFPSALRFQGLEIVRTWAFYTIFRAWALTGKKTFESILVHGMILGTDGKRMHKSRGNGVSPDDLLKKYPADAIRLWSALSGAIGKDKPFTYKDIEYAKSFITKLFNSAAFMKSAVTETGMPRIEPAKDMELFDIWILNRLNSVIKRAEESYEAFNFYDLANVIMNFYWHEFCDFYIENVKYRIYSKDKRMQKSRHAAVFVLNHVLMEVLKLLFPIIPHAAEEINSLFNKEGLEKSSFPVYKDKGSPSDYVINGVLFKSGIVDMNYENSGAFLNNIISDVRKAKAKERIALNKQIASININVPEEYYKVVNTAKEELKSICKAGKIEIEKATDYSASIVV